MLYTDGVVDARSPEGEFFGVERLAELVVRHLAGGLALPETLRRVVRELLAHHGEQLTDDATLLVLEWRGTRTTPPGSTDEDATPTSVTGPEPSDPAHVS